MVVDPTTPRAEVVRTTLLGNTLERPNTDGHRAGRWRYAFRRFSDVCI